MATRLTTLAKQKKKKSWKYNNPLYGFEAKLFIKGFST